MQSNFTAVPDWFPWENAGASVALADLEGDGRLDVLLLMIDEETTGQNAGYFRVGRGLDDTGDLTGGWTDWQRVPDWFSAENEAAGIAVADVRGTGQLDLLVFLIDAPDGRNQGYYRVGWSLDPVSGAVSGGWSDWLRVPDWFSWLNAGGDITVADVDGDGGLDLVVFMVDAANGPNQGYYRTGPLNPDGTVTTWRPWQAVPDWRFWENQGAGVAVADLDGDGTPELVVLAVDNGPEQNGAYYSVGWRLDGRGRPADGWGPWLPVPDWGYWTTKAAVWPSARWARRMNRTCSCWR
ncbi:MAG: VCBS repeat-containing protein [Jatrophihabitantaceae bacterium]